MIKQICVMTMTLMSRADCLKQYGSDYHIRKRLNTGELFRIGKGVFSEEIHAPELAVIAKEYPKAVVTMHSAFYHYGLTDVIPDIVDLATDRDAAKIHNPRVRQYFVPSCIFSLGIIESEEQGYSFRIYCKERMLIELLRYKNKLPFDFYKEILLNYRRIMPQLNIQKIQDYALFAPKSSTDSRGQSAIKLNLRSMSST